MIAYFVVVLKLKDNQIIMIDDFSKEKRVYDFSPEKRTKKSFISFVIDFVECVVKEKEGEQH